MTHELKTWPEYFERVLDGSKRFEFRDGFDREYNVGDLLHLREWNPSMRAYTGRALCVRVTYILPVFGTYKIMSIGDAACA